MFPEFSFSETNATVDTNTETDNATIGKVFMLDFGDKISVRMADGKPVEAITLKDKVSMYVQTILRTALNKYKVYDGTEFGMSYFGYLGLRNMPKSTMHSEIQREITEKVKALDTVGDVNNFSVNTNNTTITISFGIVLNDGTTQNISESVVI